MTGYFQLLCRTCYLGAGAGPELSDGPVIATSERELMSPDYRKLEDERGAAVASGLRQFHKDHKGHRLEVIPA